MCCRVQRGNMHARVYYLFTVPLYIFVVQRKIRIYSLLASYTELDLLLARSAISSSPPKVCPRGYVDSYANNDNKNFLTLKESRRGKANIYSNVQYSVYLLSVIYPASHPLFCFCICFKCLFDLQKLIIATATHAQTMGVVKMRLTATNAIVLRDSLETIVKVCVIHNYSFHLPSFLLLQNQVKTFCRFNSHKGY